MRVGGRVKNVMRPNVPTSWAVHRTERKYWRLKAALFFFHLIATDGGVYRVWSQHVHQAHELLGYYSVTFDNRALNTAVATEAHRYVPSQTSALSLHKILQWKNLLALQQTPTPLCLYSYNLCEQTLIDTLLQPTARTSPRTALQTLPGEMTKLLQQ